MTLVLLLFWADWAVRKISAMLQKYPTFEGSFLIFSLANQIHKNRVFTVLGIHNFDEDSQIKILIILAAQLVLLGSNCHERLIIKRALY